VAQTLEQINAGNTSRETASQHASCQKERDAVGQHKIGTTVNFAQVRIFVKQDNVLGVGRYHVSRRTAPQDEFSYGGNGFREGAPIHEGMAYLDSRLCSGIETQWRGRFGPSSTRGQAAHIYSS
jgi:hypothetical protein